MAERERLTFKSYRSRAAMERDAREMALRGWRLRAWRERKREGLAELPESELNRDPLLWGIGGGIALAEFVRFVGWVVFGVPLALWWLVRGRKRFDAAYGREY